MVEGGITTPLWGALILSCVACGACSFYDLRARHWIVRGGTSHVEAPTSKFAFLSAHDAQLVMLYFRVGPVAAIFKIGQFAELLSKTIAAHHALLEERETFERTLRRLCYGRIIPKETADLFHDDERRAHESECENVKKY
jgi:hypothetical protein